MERVALAAIALNTERIRFGPLITPLARRRPWIENISPWRFGWEQGAIRLRVYRLRIRANRFSHHWRKSSPPPKSTLIL
jgi:hypothetical protein